MSKRSSSPILNMMVVAVLSFKRPITINVTKMITSYVKEHNLQASDNGRRIIPDAKLKTLLKLKKGDELTYFNLQKYMSSHFAKASKDASA